METKRKASAAGRGGGADGGEPVAKRRKLPSVSLILSFVCGDNPSFLEWSAPWSTAAKSVGSESIAVARARLDGGAGTSQLSRARPTAALPAQFLSPIPIRRGAGRPIIHILCISPPPPASSGVQHLRRDSFAWDAGPRHPPRMHG